MCVGVVRGGGSTGVVLASCLQKAGLCGVRCVHLLAVDVFGGSKLHVAERERVVSRSLL